MIGQLPVLLAVLAAAGDQPAGRAAPSEPLPAPPPPAAPQPADLPIAIGWNAPAECPSLDALEAEVRRIAGQVPPPAEPLAAEASVRRAASGWQLTLTTRAGTRAGERKLAGPDCAELMRAAALVMALMINPQASLGPEPPPPLPPPPPPPPPPARRFAVGADVLVGSGALPGAAGGFGLRLGAGAAVFSGELRASLWLSRSTASTADPTAGGSFDLADGAVAGCARARHDRALSPGACAGASVVRLHGTGYGISTPGEASAWWTAAFAEASLRVRVTPRNAARLAVQGVVPLGKPNFELSGGVRVFEPASFWLRASLGWELHF